METKTVLLLWAALIVALPRIACAVQAPANIESPLQALAGRDLDGNALNGVEAYYDPALNITWLEDANYAKTIGFDPTGALRWINLQSWLSSLSVYGTSGWRVPNTIDVGPPGCDFSFAGTDCGYNPDPSTNELAHLWYVLLGNKAFCDVSGACPQPGWGLVSQGPFHNVVTGTYWAGQSITQLPCCGVFTFDVEHGVAGWNSEGNKLYAWLVHDGDIGSPIPEPSRAALAAIGLLLTLFAARQSTHVEPTRSPE